MRTRVFQYFAGYVLTVLLCMSPGRAQTVTGSISGAVTDSSGAVIPNAQVTALNTGTGVKTEVRTNASGAYTIRFLPIGPYTVSVSAPGFATQTVPQFSLEINQTVKVNTSLTIGASSSNIEVEGNASPILNTNL